MILEKINYSDLNSRQKEIYNFQKIAAVLADYGFNCIKLADDWQGADFLAYHKDGRDTLRVQLKARLTIDKKYNGKKLHLAFPVHENWYLVEHDTLVEIIGKSSNWLNSESWIQKGHYNSVSPNGAILSVLEKYQIGDVNG